MCGWCIHSCCFIRKILNKKICMWQTENFVAAKSNLINIVEWSRQENKEISNDLYEFSSLVYIYSSLAFFTFPRKQWSRWYLSVFKFLTCTFSRTKKSQNLKSITTHLRRDFARRDIHGANVSKEKTLLVILIKWTTKTAILRSNRALCLPERCCCKLIFCIMLQTPVQFQVKIWDIERRIIT